MHTVLSTAVFYSLLMSLCCCCASDQTNILVATDWSEPVASVRGRLLVVEGYSPGYEGTLPETKVYLDLQNVSTSTSGVINIFFNPKIGLQCRLLDANNEPPPPVGGGGSGSFPSACLVTLPYDCTIRLRASWYGYGMPREKGIRIPLYTDDLVIKANNTNTYYLSGTFTGSVPSDDENSLLVPLWQETLVFPKVGITAKR